MLAKPTDNVLPMEGSNPRAPGLVTSGARHLGAILAANPCLRGLIPAAYK